MMISLDFSKLNGLIPAIAQDYTDNSVLMLAYMNEEAFKLTCKTGEAHYYSRSRKRVWKKGETSGHVQLIKEIRVDCDSDTLLLIVEQKGGAACHTGYRSCFFRKIEGNDMIITEEKVFDPDKAY